MKFHILFLYVLLISLFSINSYASLTCNESAYPTYGDCFKCQKPFFAEDGLSDEQLKQKLHELCKSRPETIEKPKPPNTGSTVLDKAIIAANDKGIGEDESETKTAITAKARENDLQMDSEFKSLEAEFVQISQRSKGCFIDLESNIPLGKISKLSVDYINEKTIKCTKAAERAEFLCSEGTSPAAKNARTIMSVSGPVLAAMSSALNACSTVGKVTGFASKLLLLAKGACLTSKTLCDHTCTSIAYRYEESFKTINSTLKSPTQNPAPPLAVAALCPEAKMGLNNLAAKIENLWEKERTQEEKSGSARNLVGICNRKDQDLASFAANITSLMVAGQSADNCKKQLTAEGGGATTQQYCEKADNVQTQFCKCQRDSTQEGCPGYVANSTNNNSNPDNSTGANIKSDGGLSSFAGGTKPGSTAGSGGTGDLGSGGIAGEESTAGVAAGANTFQGSANPGVSGGGGSRGGFGNNADDAVSAGKPEDKKSFFGGLASSVGNMFKGLTGGSNGKPTTTQLAEKRKEAAARRIASEKVAAEISRANGKSNWQKVREQYLSTEQTLMVGQ